MGPRGRGPLPSHPGPWDPGPGPLPAAGAPRDLGSDPQPPARPWAAAWGPSRRPVLLAVYAAGRPELQCVKCFDIENLCWIHSFCLNSVQLQGLTGTPFVCWAQARQLPAPLGSSRPGQEPRSPPRAASLRPVQGGTKTESSETEAGDGAPARGTWKGRVPSGWAARDGRWAGQRGEGRPPERLGSPGRRLVLRFIAASCRWHWGQAEAQVGPGAPRGPRQCPPEQDRAPQHLEPLTLLGGCGGLWGGRCHIHRTAL